MADPTSDPQASRLPRWLPPTVFAVLAIAMFADVLWSSGTHIVSAPDTDLTMHFVASREFGFGELARGNLPLWNPHMFAGYPYFGGFQPALLYPPNWLFIVLPLGFAINFGIALHVFLGGWFTYLWLKRSIADRANAATQLAALAGGIAFIFCGRFFLHVYAGHLPHICLVPWLPVLLMSIDGLARERGKMLRWSLIGAGSSAMMLLAGYPQMLYYALVVLPIYVVWRWVESPMKLRMLGGLAAVGALSIGLCAAQLWTGVEAARESVRQRGTSYEFSASFSFPPENLVTLIAPDALGRLPESVGESAVAPYFGQGYLWEMSTFVGSIAMLLAIVGAISGGRRAILPGVMVLVTAALGLGANLPLHRWMYDWFPGFSTFRGSSKFFYLTSLFLIQLSAIGLLSIVRQPKRIWPAAVAVGLALVIVGFGYKVKQSAYAGRGDAFATAMKAVADRALARQDYYYPQQNFDGRTALRLMGRTSGRSFYYAGAWMLAGGAAIALARWRPRAAGVAIVALIAVESFTFARMNRPTSPFVAELPAEWVEALRPLVGGPNRFVRNPSEYDYHGPELSRTLDAWGYDPGILARYGDMMRVGQNLPPESARWGLGFRQEVPAIFRLARITKVLESRPAPGAPPAAFPMRSTPLPPAIIVPNAIVMPGEGNRETILKILTSPAFDPSSTVLLEAEPHVPQAGAISITNRPTVRFDVIDTDTRRIRVDLPAAAMLLVTESYSKDWKARALSPPPAGQGDYRVVPGDVAFIALPLSAGKHEIELSYSPRGWVIGRWISLASVMIFAGLAVTPLFARRSNM